MFSRNRKRDGVGDVDGGEGRGVPLGGRDDRPPTGYQSDLDDDREFSRNLDDDLEFSRDLWDEGDSSDRRRDPLRRP